jgi:rsbT co-antagonist protein RsbR
MSASSASDPDERVERLRAELERRSAALEHISIITKTFVALSLHEREAIADTVLALTCSFLRIEHGAILIRDTDPELVVAASYGLDAAALTDEHAGGLWELLLDERVAQNLDAARVGGRWPDAPDFFMAGLSAVSVDIQDRPLGLIVLGHTRAEIQAGPLDEIELEYLTSLSALTALFIAHGDGYRGQQRLLAEVERQAEAARRAAAETQRTVEQLDAQLLVVEEQRVAIRELSTPILAIWDRVLVAPLIGQIDISRSFDLMESLLTAIAQRRACHAIIDVTGVVLLDTETANYLLRIVRAAALLGAECVLTGIQPAVAQTLTTVGVDLSVIVTRATLERGLAHCIDELAARDRSRTALDV